MQLLNWKIYGKGNINIILIHGWGINSKIWLNLTKKLKKDFCVHLFDLPGYGNSKEIHLSTLDQLINVIMNDINVTNVVLVGWSLGGLIATKMVLSCPNIFKGLVLVSFSPYFCVDYNWPGINNMTLINFINGLHNDYIKTMLKFICLQNINIKLTKQERINLKNIILNKKTIPSIRTLIFGLKLLEKTDLRKLMNNISIPHITIYGKLDSIVPYKIAFLNKNKKNTNFILENSAHMPFISENNNFYNILYNFINKFK
ncbi:MAG: pimeloyl-ACP methyl ester esterase BioH [Candidatus Lightella neohaematopini]|nr:pimeloyl-ACP methyl ester esterase BioH [Candidatus Lightella neohaematopini]MCV2528832.1 pimeloyl-ACP methyl ester esterase BioH [Candidatus Lightella neohaematopini]